MEQTIRCFDDPVTQKALKGYAQILREKIEVPKEKRSEITEVFNLVQNDEFIKKIEKR
jgi:hypothetical protein